MASPSATVVCRAKSTSCNSCVLCVHLGWAVVRRAGRVAVSRRRTWYECCCYRAGADMRCAPTVFVARATRGHSRSARRTATRRRMATADVSLASNRPQALKEMSAGEPEAQSGHGAVGSRGQLGRGPPARRSATWPGVCMRVPAPVAKGPSHPVTPTAAAVRRPLAAPKPAGTANIVTRDLEAADFAKGAPAAPLEKAANMNCARPAVAVPTHCRWPLRVPSQAI